MSDWFLLYLLTRVDDVRGFFAFAVFAGIFIVGFVFALRFTGGPDESQSAMDWGKKWSGTAVFAWCLVLLLALLTPSRNDIVFIVGGSKLLEISRGDTATRLGSKTLSIVEKYLDDAASSRTEEVKQ